MSGGGHSDVKNAIWMRALLMAGMIFGLGLASYVGLGVVVAGMKETAWDDEAAHFHDAEDAWKDAVAAGEIDSSDKNEPLYEAKEDAHHHEIEAHLSYLTYRVSGLTLLFVSIIFAVFLGISGIRMETIESKESSSMARVYDPSRGGSGAEENTS